MAHRGLTWRQAGLVGSYVGVALVLFLPDRLHAQTTGTISQNPVNPLGLPNRFANYPRPVSYAPVSVSPKFRAGKEGTPSPSPTPLQNWSVTLSGSYQFSNDRSRVGDVSLDSQSGIIDLAVVRNCWPYTAFDASYIYSYANGSSPTGKTLTANQHAGSLRVFQPLEPFFLNCEDWKPPSLNTDQVTKQFAAILSASYGGTLISQQIAHLPSTNGTAYTFVGNALLDYQHGWFPNHYRHKLHGHPIPKCYDYPQLDDNYPSWFLEFSTGIQFSTTRLDSGSGSTAGRQLTYQNIGSFSFSFPCRLGFLVSAEWDAPLDSDPLRSSQPYYANIAIFTGGLIYNYYPSKNPAEKNIITNILDRCSASLLYSYTAFDPLTETNRLLVQVSYTF